MIEILSKPVDRIGIGEIESLTASKVPESEQIEFKEELPAKGDGGIDPWMSGKGQIGNRARNILLEEVTAFANAFGGALLLGIRETDAKPPVAEEIAPVPQCTELSERLKLMFRDCVEPPLPWIEIVGVPVRDDCGVVVIRVGKSRLAPHRVKTTLVCPVRRQNRCERMTMREIQDMTLNVSRGLERLDKRLLERAERFQQEFQRLRDPDNAIGVRATAVPIGDQIRFDRVYSERYVVEGLLEPWHGVLFEKDEKWFPLKDPFHPPRDWRPILRAARADCSHASDSYRSYEELHCDGLVELGFVSGSESLEGKDLLLLRQNWPLTLLANLMTQAHRLRNQSGVPSAEYAVEVEIDIRGFTAMVVREFYPLRSTGEFDVGTIKFPRYSLGEIDEIILLLNLFERDFWNSFGKEIGANEGMLSIEHWPEKEPDEDT